MGATALSALNSSLSLDNDLLLLSSTIVVVGVVVEFAELLLFNKDLRPLQRRILFAGAVLVIIGCAGEVVFELRAMGVEAQLQQYSDQVVARLGRAEAADNRIATQAAKDAAKLGVGVSGLHDFVATKERESDAQRSKFEEFAQENRRNTAAVLADLSDSRVKLEGARIDAVSAATAAKQDVVDMTTALNQEHDLRNRFAAMVVPRQIDDTSFAALVTALKSFPDTKADFATTKDPEAVLFLERLTDAITAAGWKIEPWAGNGFGLTVPDRPDLPQVGEGSGRGIQVNVADSDKTGKLADAALALARPLSLMGFLVFANAQPEKLANGKPNPSAVKAGTIHITIGAKQ